MKKIILSTLTVLSTTFLFGQSSFGVKAGMNFSTTEGFVTENKYIVAEHLGVYTITKIGKKFLLRPELLYSMKGYRFPAIGTHDRGTLAFSYLTIPVLFCFQPTENTTILLGPEIGYLVNAKYRFPDSTAKHPEYFNKVDVAINLGGIYTISKRFAAELRYSYGFKGLVDVTYTDQFGNETGKDKLGAHRLFQLSFNYQLNSK